MPKDPNYDQGFSVRVSREAEELVRKIAQAEDRQLRVVVERAIREYADRAGVK